jgi:hypothetical protein
MRTGMRRAVGDANAEHDIYDDDAICDYPQSGTRFEGIAAGLSATRKLPLRNRPAGSSST